jgi:hypothetical protein
MLSGNIRGTVSKEQEHQPLELGIVQSRCRSLAEDFQGLLDASAPLEMLEIALDAISLRLPSIGPDRLPDPFLAVLVQQREGRVG